MQSFNEVVGLPFKFNYLFIKLSFPWENRRSSVKPQLLCVTLSKNFPRVVFFGLLATNDDLSISVYYKEQMFMYLL